MSRLMRCAHIIAALCVALLLQTSAQAADSAAKVDADRLYLLTSELRCLVCQNESLADSNAPLALDLKAQIRARMAAGDNDDQIKRFLVERYGDFVTYRPPLSLRTLLLWLGPLLILGGGGFVMWRAMRSSNTGDTA